MRPLIVLMLDGVGADQVRDYKDCMPHLREFCEVGLFVERLAPERCATSMPGRASTLTGAASAVHGVYGNVIWDGAQFRPANHADLRVPSLARLAKNEEKTVACVGFGMVDPDDCDYFEAPFWSAEMLCGDGQADHHWTKVMRHRNAGASLLSRNNLSSDALLENGQQWDDYFARRTTQVGQFDLLLVEFASPDYFLHRYGTQSEETRRALQRVDTQIGELLAGSEDANVVVVSDHGFTDISETLHPDVLLGDRVISCEGGILFVHAATDDDRKILRDAGASQIDNEFLPADQRHQISAFRAPDGCDFYVDYSAAGQTRGASKYRANHGFAAGHRPDDRFAVAMGPDIARKMVNHAPAEDIAPTLARLLELSVDDFVGNSLL